MIKAGSIEKGMVLRIKDEPYSVTEREFVNPGKGSAFVRLKLKNLRTGAVLKEVIKTQDSVEEIDVEDRECQYLYSDGNVYHFMDNETFEQFGIPVKEFQDLELLMKEGDVYTVVMWEDSPIDIKLPYKIVYMVKEAQEGLKGDTVSGATKIVKTETGLEVKVPLFIKEGDKILVNTESREYVERVNQ
ncbi:MAG: elongation factor P [Spirochaetes bacterium]|nr:MAG: elongation factor P [Spirochaetota bacterium]